MTGADAWIYRNDFPLSWGWFKYLPTMVPRICRHLCQRMRRGFSEYDMWNANHFLPDVISGSAYWLFAHTQSYPMHMTYDEWLEILREIGGGFGARDEDFGPVIPDLAFDLFREYLREMWD